MKRVPARKSPGGNKVNEKRFLEGKGGYPWDEGDEGDERIIKSFNLRLPEPLHMKLQFIAENTPHSIHNFVMEAVEEAVERALEDMIGK